MNAVGGCVRRKEEGMRESGMEGKDKDKGRHRRYARLIRRNSQRRMHFTQGSEQYNAMMSSNTMR
jgi:hypothetical protein